VRDELVADLATVAGRIVATVRREIPAYEGLAASQLDEVSRIAAWGTSRVLDAWVADEQLGAEDLARFRGIGAARALDGRPLPVVLRAYRVAGSTVTDLVAERARGRLDVDDAIALARLWMASIDALSEALYAGHEQASERLESDQALADFTDDLLTGRHTTSAAVAARASRLGVTLPRRVGLLHAGPSPSYAGRSAPWADLLERLAPTGTARLARTRDGTGTVLLGEWAATQVDQHLGDAGWRGVLLERPVDALARGARLALHALAHAPAYAWNGRSLLGEGDALALAQATGHPDADATALVEATLGPLAPHPHLLAGLTALLAAGSVSGAAAADGHHVQTMHHRVRRVAALTGRDPRRPWDRFVLELATLVDQ